MNNNESQAENAAQQSTKDETNNVQPHLHKTAVGRRLFFNNDNFYQPRKNQRVLIYTSNRKEKWLADLKYITATYQNNEVTGKSVYILDVGGILEGIDIIWSDLYCVDSDQIDKILGLPPF